MDTSEKQPNKPLTFQQEQLLVASGQTGYTRVHHYLHPENLDEDGDGVPDRKQKKNKKGCAASFLFATLSLQKSMENIRTFGKMLSDLMSSGFSKASAAPKKSPAPNDLAVCFAEQSLAVETIGISERAAAEIETALADIRLWEQKRNAIPSTQMGPYVEDLQIHVLKTEFGLKAHPETGAYIPSLHVLQEKFDLSATGQACTIQVHRPMTLREQLREQYRYAAAPVTTLDAPAPVPKVVAPAPFVLRPPAYTPV
ncbi:MAG: hypothetical protein H6853_04350 [Rhodospirillales bacterium]|nr:hypothetical protein [Alphaproteobacteria bacterium]USO04500.1 MAG: hypothetical protein H6853_04350 [Rhodospirillales bacterium]